MRDYPVPAHKESSEPRRTSAPTFAPTMTELEAWRLHDRLTKEFTDALREGRCRRSPRFHAHLGQTVGVLAPIVGPWNLEVLFFLYMHGPQRFSALKRGLGGISSRVLTDKLRHLAEHGLVERQEAGAAVTYALAPRGDVVARHLHPVVFHLRNPVP